MYRRSLCFANAGVQTGCPELTCCGTVMPAVEQVLRGWS
jgi:hypothetical protein